jgi:hypothetical protein
VKDSFYEELERIFNKFPKYRMKILLGDWNAKVGREDIFKPTIGNESLHEISDDNGVRVANFATSKISLSKVLWRVWPKAVVTMQHLSLLGNRNISMDSLTTPVFLRCMVTNNWKASVSIVAGSVKEGKTLHASQFTSAGLRS